MSRPTYDEIVKFHGHACPGLAIGYRMTLAGMERLAAVRAADEELVAIVENDACGVDALQCLSGCTFGKGNLLFRDYGKQVYTLYCRRSRRGVRVLYHGRGMPEAFRGDRGKSADWILSAPRTDLIDLADVTIEEPEPARIRASRDCDRCGERVMESRIVQRDGRALCIPCSREH